MNHRPLTRRALLGGLAASALAPIGRRRTTAARVPAAAGGSPLRQMRGMWIASVENINWPSAPGLPAARQRAEFASWLDLAEARRMNAVFVQVRPTADAFWPSRYEPWSQYLTGVQGRDPGYDPLGFMIEATHERGLAFHAWFNPYRVSMQPDPARLVPEHPVRRNPGWGVAYAGKLYYNPGLPEVRAFVQDAIMDAVTRYDIDGAHFDDYFYPYPIAGQVFDDSAAYARHGAGFPDLAAWRRNNVDLLIQEMSGRIRKVKPEAQWGVSPFGIWRNATSDPLGSATSGSQSYDQQYADTRGWVRKGWLDYVAPQIYWNIGLPEADYAVLTPWWAGVVAGTGTQLWIGQAAYKTGAAAEPPAWRDPAELSRHLTFNAGQPLVGGDIYYNSGDVRADRLGSITLLQKEHYTRPALSPVLPRLSSGAPPRRPDIVRARLTGQGVELAFQAAGQGEPRLYAVYRFDDAGAAGDGRSPGVTDSGGEGSEIDASRLVAVVPGGRRGEFTDPAGRRGARYRVTALDRVNRQSAPSAPHEVR
ncbi:glycoside hydrolase family 10 protein [Sphaerisporangium corydalis]|uniref:Glycoside hydrolase family 10 protein n=1 Tax=Sphaerisporangium corydalis TaxID=1441875 RepID=A0ABV9E6M9_9ACTN|nr:family 10 glycosylhydrolase [Sphaerisporangium corydalis]